MAYVELQVTSNFTFLTGASFPDELVHQADAYGYNAIAFTERNSLAGIVRAHIAAKDHGLRLIVGCRLDLQDGPSLLAYPTDRAAYGRLSKLLTIGKMRAPKGECYLNKDDVYTHKDGIKFIVVSPETIDPAFLAALQEYRSQFGRELSLGATCYFQGNDAKRLAWLAKLSKETFTPLVATNDVHYHHPHRRELQDILTCIRHNCTIHTAGFRLLRNAERHLKPEIEMKRLFRDYPEAIQRTQHIADVCTFSLEELRYEYPDELTADGRTPQQELEYQIWKGVKRRLGSVDKLPNEVRQTLDKELSFIAEMNYAPYFLTVYDIVRYAREQGILCQGRGSAANSVVCYYLGITSVDPEHFNLLFERFLSNARNEPPDIDVDFEHERREEVMQYVFNKYGRHRAGIVATVAQYRQKGALRDVAKAMGLSADIMKDLSGSLMYYLNEWVTDKRLDEYGFDKTDPHLLKAIQLAHQLLGFPRHLSQHTGGFVITKGELGELCPIMNASMVDRTCIEWNKDDIDALGFLKVDVLALGMLTAIQKAFSLFKHHYDVEHDLATIPQNDTATYEMISRADTIGVFQVESRAQMSMLPRLKPNCFYDLVVQVAIVRPGPIQGDMVHPYLLRRQGKEAVEYHTPELEAILSKTLGVPLFQEQAMEVAIHAGGFTPTEADMLRRSIAKFKSTGEFNFFQEKLMTGMLANGYPREYAERLYRQFEGFGYYGFPQSHAASFAHLVYASAWVKRHHPDVFTCALMNSQPMGFYQPAQLIRDAREHGVTVLPIDINHSGWDCTLEPQEGQDYCSLRLGFRQVKGLRFADVDQLVTMRQQRLYNDVSDLWRRAGVSATGLERLADADAFQSVGLNRRQALWEVKALGDTPLPAFVTIDNEGIQEAAPALPAMIDSQEVVHDYATTSLSLRGQPVRFLRDRLTKRRIIPANQLRYVPPDRFIKVAGLVFIRQRPSTAKDVMFATIEDETGVANMVIFKKIRDKYRKAIISGRLLVFGGHVQQQDDVIHVIVKTVTDLTDWLSDLNKANDTQLPLLVSRADEIKHGTRGQVRESHFVPASRDFR